MLPYPQLLPGSHCTSEETEVQKGAGLAYSLANRERQSWAVSWGGLGLLLLEDRKEAVTRASPAPPSLPTLV